MNKLNKYILLVMKYLDDPSSVSKDELVENRSAAAADADADAAYAAAADADADAAYAEKWVNKYFERSGENKQDYIGSIEAGKSGVVDMPKAEAATEWIPTGRCIHLFNNGRVPLSEEEVNIVGVDKDGFYVFQNDKSTCYYCDPAEYFVKLKTKEDKEREAFIEAGVHLASNTKGVVDITQAMLIVSAMHKAGFKAPEGE